ncbi:hypothetical protein BKK49_02115 [Rodentibacter rarus]|uniref:hypothetical protein n=1 Tax=Rodentibacter rarus TaxID=1908260 RepID=UPI0009847619|nr:hypothetical protein [Rodentibacter rarus]OOF42612.1 hypothetical protein BKK49_02115 [Rodentibacter rarus]
MGVKARMKFFVKENLSGLNDEDIEFLTEHILSSIGFTPRNFMSSKEVNKFEDLFKKEFSEIFNEYKEITPYEFFLIKKNLEAKSGLLLV